MFDPKSHPRDSRGRFCIGGFATTAERGRAAINAHVVAAEGKRDEISASIPDDGYDTGTSDDFHPYTPDTTGPNPLLCSVCGDDEGANDHQDPAEHARVWMDVEGLTLADIDTLDHFVAVVTRKLDEAGEYDTAELDVALLVSDWINGTEVQSAEDRSRFLEYPGALDGLMAFVSDVLAERQDNQR